MSTQYLEHDGGRIAFDDTGAGPLVVCVPGMGDLRAEYRFLTPQLVSAGYRVATMDVRGHGEASVGWADVSVAAIGSDILALIRHLDAGPATIVGTSMAAKWVNQPKCAAASSRSRPATGTPRRRPMMAAISRKGTPSSAAAW